MVLIKKLIAHEMEINKENKPDTLKDFLPPVSRGKKTIPKNKLTAIERAITFSRSINKPIDNYLYRSHFHYWGLLFHYHSLSNLSKEHRIIDEVKYNLFVTNAWVILSDGSDITKHNMLFDMK